MSEKTPIIDDVDLTLDPKFYHEKTPDEQQRGDDWFWKHTGSKKRICRCK